MYILWLPLMLLGLPVAIIASILGKQFGDGTGNESGFASFFDFSMKAGIAVVVVMVGIAVAYLALNQRV